MRQPLFIKLMKNIANWIAPLKCLVCSQTLSNTNHPCCHECYATLPFQDNACQHCGQRLLANLDYCGQCLATPPPFDACFCPFRYEEPINEQIRQLKYGDRPELANLLAKLIKREAEANDLEFPELLIPVPAHISKLRERGFNQSLLLTKQLSKLLSIPYNANIIRKHRATPPQVQQTFKFRQQNLKGSFTLNNPTTAKHIAIIDDVVTTGATATEITKILKRNGVNYVQVWGVAHTV